jgi:hypothetical protein
VTVHRFRIENQQGNLSNSEKSLFHSLAREKAKEKRKLARTPVYNSHSVNSTSLRIRPGETLAMPSTADPQHAQEKKTA